MDVPQQDGCDALRVLPGQWVQRDAADGPERFGEACVRLEELRPGGGDHEQGDGVHVRREVVEEEQQGLVGPVQVLEDEDQRTLGGKSLDEGGPGGEVLLARGFGGVEADESAEPQAQPLLVGPIRGDRREFDGRRPLVVRLEHPGVRLDDLAERGERHAVAIRQAAALAPCREVGEAVDVGEQFRDQPGLADAGIPDQERQLRRLCGDRSVEQGPEQGELDLAADQRREPGVVGLHAGA